MRQTDHINSDAWARERNTQVNGIVVWRAAGLIAAIVGLAMTAQAQPAEDMKELFQGPSRFLRSILANEEAQPEPAPQPAAPPPASEAPPPARVNYGEKPEVVMDDTGLIEFLHVRNQPISAVLDMIALKAKVNIVTSTEVDGRISANLFDVTVDEALNAILLPNQLGYRQMGNVLFVATAEELTAGVAADAVEVRVFPLYYIPREDAIPLVKAVLSDVGKIAPPRDQDEDVIAGAYEFRDAGEAQLVVIDTAIALERVGFLLEQIDVRPQQVLIEASILRATLNEDNALGIDMSLLSGVDFRDVGGQSSAARNLTVGNIPEHRFDDTTMNVSSSLIGDFPAGGFTFGVIHNNVATFIRALEQVTDVTVLANPKVLALNKQMANVIIGRRDGYLTTTVTETAAIQTVEFLETGTQIELRPIINRDGTVRLDIRPKDSNGGLNASNLPFEETTEAHAQLIIENGNTVLIGGLFRERTVRGQSQLPLLGEVPGLGLLFQRQSDQTVREEIIILITVRVLDDSLAERNQTAEIAADIERLRTGNREGLMGTGRERLVQAYYQEALRRFDAGDEDRALLNCRLALHSAPNHLGARKLMEQILRETPWDADNSRLRTFLFELLEERTGVAPGDAQRDPLNRPWEHEELMQGVLSESNGAAAGAPPPATPRPTPAPRQSTHSARPAPARPGVERVEAVETP